MTKLLITGATGSIGRALVAESKRLGHEVVFLSRAPEHAGEILPGVAAYRWEPEAGQPPAEALRGIDAVIHLAGESARKGRWTRKRMASIRASRVIGTRNLVQALAAVGPRVFVCASAVGWYGDRGDEVLTEDAPPGDDFLAGVCRDWEAEAARARERGARWVSIRTGIVLGKDDTALQSMLPVFRMNMGGTLAGGRQWMSWIHMDDLVGLYLFAVESGKLAGPVNGTAPHPVTNREFTKTLGRVLGKWTFMNVPGWVLRLAIGRLARYATRSQRCDPAAARQAGYEFRFPELEGALREILAGC